MFLINNTVDNPQSTTPEKYYKEDINLYTGVVGALRQADKSTYIDNFEGFIYGFYIDNRYITDEIRS